MKKAVSICLALIMVMSMSLTALAAPGKFVSSPSGNRAPIIVEYDKVFDECSAELIITPYAERNTLPEDLRKQFEDAYNDIKETDDLSDLNSRLAQEATKLGVDVSALEVSDLFNLHETDCEIHEGHGKYDVTLKPETLKNFVGLLHYVNGSWSFVDNVSVTNNGEYLEFNTDGFGPYAIVVNTGAAGGTDGPHTSDLGDITVYALVMLACAFMIVVLWKKSKKQAA